MIYAAIKCGILHVILIHLTFLQFAALCPRECLSFNYFILETGSHVTQASLKFVTELTMTFDLPASTFECGNYKCISQLPIFTGF